MSTAAVWAGDTSATLAFESRETGTLTCCAIADTLVAALTVEVCLVPGLDVGFTGKTVSVIILFANKTIGVLVLNLLVRVEVSVRVHITEWRVDKRFPVQTKSVGAIVSKEVEFAFAHTPSITNAIA